MIDVTAVDTTAYYNRQNGAANSERLPAADADDNHDITPDPYKEPYYDNGDQDRATTDLSPANRVGSYAATDAAERKKHNHYNNRLINCDFIVGAITVRGVIGQEFTQFLHKLAEIAKKNNKTPASMFYLNARRKIIASVLQQRWRASRYYNDRLPPNLKDLPEAP